MKKTVIFLLIICLSGSIFAQSALNSKDNSLKRIQEKMELFCNYVEKVGTTKAISKNEKKRICQEGVPALFVDYENRYMLINSGIAGERVRKKLMKSYFNNLMYQAESGLLGKEIEYSLKFDYFDNENKDDIQWEYKGTDKNEVKVYEGEVEITQYYIVKTIRNGEVVYKYYEEDIKTIKVIKRIAPNGVMAVGLGDVTSITRKNQGRL